MTLKGAMDWYTSAAFHPNGSQIAAGNKDHAVYVWDSANGKLKQQFKKHSDIVTAVEFVRGGSRIASSSKDHTVRVWNAESGAVEFIWNLDEQEVVTLAAKPDGKLIAAATADSRIRFLDAETGRVLAHCRHGDRGVSDLAFSPDGLFLAAARKDGSIDIWNVSSVLSGQTTLPHEILEGHTSSVSSIAYSPNGGRLASASSDHTVKLWDVHSGHQLLSFSEVFGSQSYVGFSPDGLLLKKWDADRTYEWTIDRFEREGPTDAPLVKSLTEIEWHASQLMRATKTKNSHAILYHASRLIELEPSNHEHFRVRGLARNALKLWDLAEQDLRSASEHQDDSEIRVTRARLALQRHELAAYREHCRWLVKHFKDAPSRARLNGCAWLSALSPESGIDLSTLIFLLDEAIAKERAPTLSNTLALALFRAGRVDEALGRSQKNLDPMSINAPFDWVVTALCHAKLRDTEESRELISKVHEWICDQGQLANAGLDVAATFASGMDPDLRLLLEEAESMTVANALDVSPSPVP